MMRLFFLITLAFALVGASLVPGTAADWSRFRGPNGTGVGEGELPKINPKAPLWKVKIPGRGVGSPVVMGGKVYLQTAAADGSTRTLLCFNAADGREMWSQDVPGTSAKMHAKNTLASATPSGDGESIFCVWWDGSSLSLHAYDSAGKEKWRTSLGGYVSQHGPGMSPVLFNGMVFVNVDDDERAELVAYDAKGGEKKWSAIRKHYRASYTSPFILERNGKSELILGTTTAITSYDPAAGKVNWNYDVEWPKGTPILRAVGQPVHAGGVIVLYCGEGGNSRYVVAIKPGGPDGRPAPAKAWEARKQIPYVPSVLVRNDLLFWLHDDGRIGCTQAKTGKVLWEELVFSTGATASLISAGNEMLAISEKGQVIVLKADAEFEEAYRAELGEAVYATPALSDGRIFIRGITHLYCFGKK